MPPILEPSAELKARVLASIKTRPSPTRDEARWSAPLVVLGSAVLLASLYLALGGREHGAGRSPATFASSMSVWIAAALLALWAGVKRGRAPEGRPRLVLLAVVFGLPLAVMAVMLAMSASAAGDGTQVVLRPSSSCLALTLAAAIPGVLCLLFARRGSDAVHPTANGAALGAAFGTYAGVMVCLWCPDVTPLHIALGHVAPVVLLALLGAALGRHLLDLRR